MTSPGTGFLDSLVSAVRDNPLAAALIGGGAAWLLIGNQNLKNSAATVTAAATPIVDITARKLRTATSRPGRPDAPPTAPEMGEDLSPAFAENARQAASSASDFVSGAAETVRQNLGDSMAQARDRIGNLANPLPGKEAFAKLQSSLSDTIERQPLVIGMIGLAIGAAVAGAFRASDLENEWAGDLSDSVKADLGTRAQAVTQSLREASDTLQAELGDTGAEAVNRLKQAGIDAARAARDSAG